LRGAGAPLDAEDAARRWAAPGYRGRMTHADRLVNCRASKLVVSVALVVGCASDDGTTDTAASSSTGDPTGEPIAPAEGLWIFTPGAELERDLRGRAERPP
jgi:hypothetical protein